MAYNTQNFLQRVIEIQKIVIQEQKRGYMNQKEIYYVHIKPRYHISIRTFYNYLARNAKKELADIEERNRLKEIADNERQRVVLNSV